MIVNIDNSINFFALKENKNFYFENETFISNNLELVEYFQQTLRFEDKTFYMINKNKFEKCLNKYNFINNKTKIFIPNVFLSFSNFFIDTFGVIVETLKNIKNPFFIIDMNFDQEINKYMNGDHRALSSRYHINFLKDFLEKNNIEYVFLKDNYSIAFNNCYIINSVENSDRKFKEIYKASKIYNKNKTFDVNKKIYLIRNLKKDIDDADSYHNKLKKRIVNENILIEYLKNLGFECIVPEQIFKSIEDQMIYFKSVKTIFSVTSSSLLNSLFMPENGNVIELVSPMIDNSDLQYYRLHSDLYLHMCYSQNHNYFAIPNYIDGHQIVSYIENNKTVLEILRG